MKKSKQLEVYLTSGSINELCAKCESSRSRTEVFRDSMTKKADLRADTISFRMNRDHGLRDLVSIFYH